MPGVLEITGAVESTSMLSEEVELTEFPVLSCVLEPIEAVIKLPVVENVIPFHAQVLTVALAEHSVAGQIEEHCVSKQTGVLHADVADATLLKLSPTKFSLTSPGANPEPASLNVTVKSVPEGFA